LRYPAARHYLDEDSRSYATPDDCLTGLSAPRRAKCLPQKDSKIQAASLACAQALHSTGIVLA
jgi:hypothetical protein